MIERIARLSNGSRGAVSVLVAVAVSMSVLSFTFGSGATSALLKALDSRAWLPGEGSVTQVDAADGEATVRVNLSGAGGSVEVLQGPNGTIVIDPATGQTWSLDDATYGVTGSARIARTAVIGQHILFGLSASRGTVQAYDAVTLAPVGGSIAVPGADFTQAVAGAGDVLWLADPSRGRVLRIAAGRQLAPVSVASGATIIRLGSVAGTVAALLPGAHVVKVLTAEGVQATIPLDGASGGPFFLSRQVEQGVLGIVDAGAGRVFGVDLGDRTVVAVAVASLRGLTALDGDPAVVGSVVHFVVPGSGVLTSIDTASRRVVTHRLPGGVGSHPSVRARGGAVFVNSPDGDTGLVVGTDGQYRKVPLRSAPEQDDTGQKPVDIGSVPALPRAKTGGTGGTRTRSTTERTAIGSKTGISDEPKNTGTGRGKKSDPGTGAAGGQDDPPLNPGTDVPVVPGGGTDAGTDPGAVAPVQPVQPADPIVTQPPGVPSAAITSIDHDANAITVHYAVGTAPITDLVLLVTGDLQQQLRLAPADGQIVVPVPCGDVVALSLNATGPGGQATTVPLDGIISCTPAGNPAITNTRAGNGWIEVFAKSSADGPLDTTLQVEVDGGAPRNVPNGDWSGHINVANGAHTLVVVATTNQGATSKSEPATVTAEQKDVFVYNNYGGAVGAGYPVCIGNPGTPASQPGGTFTQTMTVPDGVSGIHAVLIQIDMVAGATANLSLSVNGAQRATPSATGGGDVQFNFGTVPVNKGDTVQLRVSMSSTNGKIATVYVAGNAQQTFTLANSCPAGAPNVTRTDATLRAQVIGYND